MLPSTIALDGPAASGKSTLALRIAKTLDYIFFDTGVMYRAVTYAAMQAGIDLLDEEECTKLAESVHIDVLSSSIDDGRTNDVFVDGNDCTWEIRNPEVTRNVSTVAAYGGVREALTMQQRRIGEKGNIVMVGRDIGTVVLKNADLKIYLDASAEERAKRRAKELNARGEKVNYDEILKDVLKRDRLDSEREFAPLKPAHDAKIVDSDGFTIDQVYQKMMDLIYAYEAV